MVFVLLFDGNVLAILEAVASICHPSSFMGNEIRSGNQICQSDSDPAAIVHQVPFQEKVTSSHSAKQSQRHFAQWNWYPPVDARGLRFTHPAINSFALFSGNSQSDCSNASVLGHDASLDIQFSLSKVRHYDPRITRGQDLPFDHIPSVFGDDMVRLNLPISDAFSSSLLENSVNSNSLQQDMLSKRHDSLQERIERMQAEMEANENVQSDADTDTENSLIHHLPLGSSSSSAEDDEELELDIIKLRRPSALGTTSEKNENEGIDDEHAVDELVEMDEGNLSDDLVDEIVRMKPLQAKAARETVDGVSLNQQMNDGVVTCKLAAKLSEAVEVKYPKGHKKTPISVLDNFSDKNPDDLAGDGPFSAAGNLKETVLVNQSEKNAIENGLSDAAGVPDNRVQKVTDKLQDVSRRSNVSRDRELIVASSVAGSVLSTLNSDDVLGTDFSRGIRTCLNNAAVFKSEFSVCATSPLQENGILLTTLNLPDERIQPNQLDRMNVPAVIPGVQSENKASNITECISLKSLSDKPVSIPIDNHHV